MASPKLRRDTPLIAFGKGMACSFLGSMGGVLSYMQFSHLIAIAIATMHWLAESMADTIYPASFGADIERTTRSDQYSPHIDTLLAAGCDHSSDQIPGLE